MSFSSVGYFMRSQRQVFFYIENVFRRWFGPTKFPAIPLLQPFLLSPRWHWWQIRLPRNRRGQRLAWESCFWALQRICSGGAAEQMRIQGIDLNMGDGGLRRPQG